MRRVFRDELRRDGLAVEALLQDVEALHAALAQDQELAVECALEVERLGQIREGARRVLAGARIDTPHEPSIRGAARDGLQADAVPLPLRHELRRDELGEILLLERM